MKKLFVLFFTLLTMCCASSAFAQADREGLDLRIGAGAGLMRIPFETTTSFGSSQISYETKDPFAMNGFGGSLAIGYRWKYFGAYIDCNFTATKWDEKVPGYKVSTKNYSLDLDDDPSNTSTATSFSDDDIYFVGGVYAMARGIFPVSPKFQAELGFGIGLMYSDGDKADRNKNYKYAIISDKNGEPNVWFSIKATVALTYYITEAFGLGVYFDYLFGFENEEEKSNLLGYEVKTELNREVHIMNPGIQAIIRF